MKKGLYYVLLILFVGIFAFSAYKVGSYYYARWQSSKQTQQIIDQYVKPAGEPEPQGDPDRITVNFDGLLQENSDVAAWIYCANTNINYPVMQGSDNDYYLSHLMDGSYNAGGSIFMECSNQADFSDRNTILYGHHMKNGSMFANLMNFKKSGYYEQHDHMYIMTPQCTYRLDLLAGAVVDPDYAIYSTYPTQAAIDSIMSRSTFQSAVPLPGEEGRLVTLSTCSYEYDDARYVVLGVLTQVES